MQGFYQRALQAAGRSGKSMSEWKPIESAPKDGNAFLGYGIHDLASGNAPRGVQTGDYWRAIILWDKWRDPNRWVFSKDGLPTWSAPTHWQPLPEPPEAGKP